MPGLNSFVNGSLFDVLVVPEGGIENNTLASYDSCYEDLLQSAYLGDLDLLFQYVPLYIGNATARLNQYTPDGFTFNNNDTYAMQSICITTITHSDHQQGAHKASAINRNLSPG
ncbi:hypothetical protein KC339_g87 [Hortaea werneckii]|nr:hypothetical protein KC339_g87 [Hortaea werneckii]